MPTVDIAAGELEPPNTLKPRPWVAAVLNIGFAGLGYLYAGRPWRAVAAILGLYVWVVALVLLTFVVPSAGARIGLVIIVLLGPYLVLPLDAVRVARASPRMRRRWYQRWYTLVAVWAFCAFVVQAQVLTWVKAHVTEAFRIPTGSMAPTLLAGDLVFASPRPPNPMSRGTVVIYRVPGDDQRFVHRAVGIPGDTVAMRAFRLSVNGHPNEWPQVVPQAESSLDHPDDGFAWQRTRLAQGTNTSSYRPTYGTWGPLVLRADEYFVLGDDVANSLDSRYRGVVPRAAIAGRPVWVYFSRDPETREIRWSRIGKSVR